MKDRDKRRADTSNDMIVTYQRIDGYTVDLEGDPKQARERPPLPETRTDDVGTKSGSREPEGTSAKGKPTPPPRRAKR